MSQRFLEVNEATPDAPVSPPASVRPDVAGAQAYSRGLAERAAAHRPLGLPAPLPPTTRRPFGDPHVNQFNEDLRQRIQAAVGLHLGNKLPGIEWTKAVKPIADRAFEIAGGDPTFVAALEADVNSMMALSDTQVAERIMRGEPIGQFDGLWDAVAEVSWQVGATDLAARLEGERADAVKGTFDALTQTEALTFGLGDQTDVSPGTRVMPDQTKAQTFQTLFDVPGAWSYSPSEGLLAVTVGEQTIGVEARPGFDPDNHLDVMAEVVMAQAEGRVVGGELTGGQSGGNMQRIIDRAHDVGAFIEERPWARQFVDATWAGLTLQSTTDPEGLSTQRAELEERRATVTEESVRQASMVPFPEDATIASIARMIMGDNPGVGSADALALAADTVAENRDTLMAEFETLTQEQLIEQLQAGLEGQSPLGVAIEGTLENTLKVFETWDLFTQTIGINFIDTIRDLYAAGEVVWEGGTWEEGFEKMKAVFEPVESESGQTVFGLPAITAAEYFDLEGGWADAANLAVGVVFDPLNYLLPGAKGIRAMTRKALTNPALAPLYLKTGAFPEIARSIAGGEATSLAGRIGQRLRGVADEVLESTDEALIAEAERTLGPKSASSVRNVFASTSGMDNDDFIDLMMIAADPNGTVEQVNAVWTRALGKDWLPDPSGRVIRHSTIEGIGRSLDSIAEGKLSEEARDTIMKLVAKLSVSRTMRIGESQFMDNFTELLVQFFPADKDKLWEWGMEAATRLRSAGDPLAIKGAAGLQKEQARRAASEAGGAVRSINLGAGGDLRGVQANLRTIENELTLLDSRGFGDEASAGLRDQLERMHTIMSRRAAEASPKMAEQHQRLRTSHKQLKQATWLENDVANYTRNQMAALAAELYEDVAQQTNAMFFDQFGGDVIPIVKGKINVLAPDVPVRDWSKITGVARDHVTDEDELALMMGLAVDDANTAQGLSAIGAFNRTQKLVLPASPYEVIAFQKLARNESALHTWTQLIRGDFMRTVSRTIKGLFATNLLLNPLTAGKITLDETLRFYADTGELGKFVRATAAGLPGAGRGSEMVIQKLAAKYGDRITNPYALAYKRNVGGWSADDFADYGWVDRPPKGVRDPAGFRLADYREQAERWVNGTLLNDRRFREYARWLDSAQRLDDGTLIPPQGWVDWWENGDEVTRPGKADVRKTKVEIREQVVYGDELTAVDAFNIIDRSIDHWLNAVVDENQRNALRRAMLKAARTPGGRIDPVKDAHLLNAIAKVPGLQGREGITSRVFNVFFGGPSGRRAGVFYEHYFDEAMSILSERHAGRVLTVDDVLAAGAPDKETAEFWLKQGADNRVVSELLATTGAKTEAQLASRAATYAERRADDLMYRFTSASLAGRGIESGLMFPFARAQVDFLSWWVDYMTRPLNLFGRLPPEAKARLPEVIQSAMAGVDRVPINLRAWAKFSHMVSAVNNDHPSVVDQTIGSLTFFPTKFDSEFLLTVSPQMGPLPSWIFDIMVDQGMITEDVEANFEALFPALGFTELEGDFVDDVFNRLLPASRRSMRDLTVGMVRSIAAGMGNDIYTTPGSLGQITNIIADGKIPAATGDFQVAMVADLLAITPGDEENVWSLVPGSDAWNRRINEVAVDGALEANRQEWSQDWKDRVLPVTEYDAEYRALRAYEGMFSDQVFSDLVSIGAFQSNDLLEVDGQPRIKNVWEKYQQGTATRDELAWLDDRLTTAYFDAGRTEIMPGFSYLDFLNLSNPEISVNLINKSEDSGVPVRNEEHAAFKQQYINRLTGRLQNVPPGDTGREIIADARRRGWLVSRPVEEWATDASAAVYKSGQRAVRGVWEWVSHRTWAAGTKKSIENKTFALGQREQMILEKAGLTLETGTVFTYKEFYDLLDAFDERFNVAQPVLIDTLARGAVHGQLARHEDTYGQGLLEAIDEVDKAWRDAGVDSVEDWSEESKASVRAAFGEAITLGYTTVADYEQEIEPIFGPIDYQPPEPPPVAELEQGIRLAGDDLADMEVIDGDTLSILLADGAMRVRLIGINAPEVTQEGYSEARSNLAQVVEQADEVVLGIYRPEEFGLTQLTAPGESRLMAWLYVDGVPLYDPTVFAADNPRGAGTGGNVIDLQAILEAGR